MWRAHHYLRVFVGLSFVAGIPTWALAQDSSAMEKLASRTAHELITRKPKVLVIAPRESCNLDFQICQTFESSLRSALQQAVPGIRFIGAAEAVSDLKRKGFFAIDAYNPLALRLVARSLGSEIMVTEDLWWEKSEYKLRIDIRDPKTNERLVPFGRLEIKVARSVPDSPDNPMLVADPEVGVSVIVFKGPLPRRFVYPGCDRCPNPESIGSVGRVELIGTIGPQGKAESVSVVSSPSSAFTAAALETLRGWRFRPAVGTDGKAFATRVSLEVNFQK